MQKSLLLAGALFGGFYLSDKKKAECCGIIGIISQKRDNIGQSLSMGVELLKNRGYDSACVVTFNCQNGQVNHQIIKHAESGKNELNCIQRLVRDVSKQIVKSHIGIGHTRWATCGEKVVKNAHPHFDNSGRIFIVHNGIIGGHPEIKKKYLEGVTFNSQTDTEVIAQLLGKFRIEGFTMIESIRKTEEIIQETSTKPQWGIVIMDKQQPNKMWTSTNGSPILIGMSKDEIFVASESIAFKKETDCYFVTNDGEIFELDTEKIPQLKESMEKLGRLKHVGEEERELIMIHPPEPHKSFYSYELRQQATIKFSPEFERIKAIPFGPFLTFIACGSSYYAATSSFYFFKKLNAFQKISVFDPVEMLEGDIAQNETVCLISQSGETKDLINVIEECEKIEGVKTVGIINIEGSTIARKVDFPIYIKVGREVSVAATKSMFHQAMNLIMLACEVATKKQSAPQELIE